ncbi:MAG: DUF2339 domain-containing protein [Chthoniobacteraceae bacterium]
MNSKYRFEFGQIREDQARLHRVMRDLDAHLDGLERRLEEPVVAPAPVEPLKISPALPPPLPRAAMPPASVDVPPPIPQPAPIAPTAPVAPPLAAIPSVPPALPVVPPPLIVPPNVVETPAVEPGAVLRSVASAAAERRKESAPSPAAESATPVPPAEAPSLELRVGTYWMARIGIVILLTGFVFLGNYAYQLIVPMLGHWGKLSLLALAGVALGGVGVWLERSRESMRNFGRVLLAGGAATIYYTVYAAHFVAALRVIESPVLGGGLLLALGVGFLWHAERRRSEALALPTVLLAYFTSSINSIGGFTLFSNLLLTAAAVFFLVRHRWTNLTYLSLAATYGSYAFWRFHQVVQTGGPGSEFGMGLTFLAGYWVLFTAAVFLSAREAMRGADRMAFLSVNNAALFVFAAHHFAMHRPQEFWIFAVGYGAVLLGLAAVAAWWRTEDRELDGAYLAQGLGVITFGLAAKLTGPRLAVVLAVQSTALLAGARRRHGWIYEAAAGLCAVAACGLTLMELGYRTSAPVALGAPIAALFFFNAWWVKRPRAAAEAEAFCGRALAFALLGFAVVSTLLWQTVDAAWQPAAFALAAAVSLAALRARLREVALPGQAFLFFGLALFLTRSAEVLPAPWWSPLPLVLVALGLMHWWQRQQTVALDASARMLVELAFAGAAVVAGYCWMSDFCHGDAWLWAASAAALGTLLYGCLTKAGPLALTGQVFTVIASCSFAGALIDGHPAWHAALAPVLNLALTSLLLSRLPSARLALTGGWPLPRVAQFYRFAAMAALSAWAIEYVDAAGRVAFFAGVGALQMFFGAWSRSRERTIFGAIYATAGLVLFWVRFDVPVSWLNAFAIIAVPASLRLGRWTTGEDALPVEVRNGLVGAAMASVWLWVTRWVHEQGAPEQLTIAWAVLALLIFAAGLGLRERLYRIGGFAVLGLALLRLFGVDVWRFDTLPRIVSFLVLGAVLLVLSFVYNRFAEAMRRWL